MGEDQKRKRRRLKWWLGLGVLFLLGIAVLALTYAHWLPYAARPLAERFGMGFAGYERLEDGRFRLTDLTQTNRLFDLRISRVEGFLPHVWRSKIRGTNQPANFLEVNGWRLLFHERAKDSAPSGRKDRSVFAMWKRTEDWLAKARAWVPKATLLNGIIEHRGKEYALSVVTWDRGVVDGSGVWPISAVPVEIKGKLTGEPPYQVSYAMHPLDLRARLRLFETNNLLRAQLAGFYKENRADLTADFGTNGLFPLTATLQAPDFKLPAELLKLEKYSEVTGSLTGNWRSNQYTLELKAHVEPLASSEDLAPADMDLAMLGDTHRVRVERAVSTIPGLQLTISDPLELSYRGEMLSERSEIQIAAELEKIPKLKLNGRVEGKILLEKGGRLPTATLRASGTNLSGLGVRAEFFMAEGRLAWPRLESFAADVRLSSNTKVAIQGSANLQTRTLGETLFQAEGPMLTSLAPAGVGFDNIKVSATAAGGLTNLHHSGQFEVREFVAPRIQPLTVEASWKAQHFTFDKLALRARAGPTEVFIDGSRYAGGGRTNFIVRELALAKGDQTYLALTEPAKVTLTTNSARPGVQWQIDPLVLKGTNRQLRISGGMVWPSVALVDLRATNINPGLFQYFVRRSLRGLDLEELNIAAGWSNGPVTGSIAGKFSVAQESFERLRAAVDVRLETNGLTLNQASISNPGSEIFRARGLLPLSVHPFGTNRLRLSMRDEIVFEGEAAPNETFWSTVASLTGVRASNTALRLRVRGTTRNPTGDFHLKGASLGYLSTNRSFPAIGPFEGSVVLNEQLLSIPQLSFGVENQPVNLTGKMKLGENFWTQRREEIFAYMLDHAELHVDAPELKLEAFAGFLPKNLRAQGSMVVDASILPGRKLDGRISVRDVETRPIPRIGVVQDVRAELLLRDREVQFENLSGVIGGETLSLGGTLDISEESFSKGYPDLDFSIQGYNVPLARNPDVILRSDLDLRVRNGTNRIPVITGAVTLRDSFLLSDIAKLVPGRVARPERRPPYFTLPQDPIDEWRLDVRVRGENFMRVRSPFFQGVVSANLHVTGDLEEPMALGEAAITSGRVVFPFATLEVKQALVSLTIENPYLPHVFMVAAGRAFGFDLRMEAEGPADEPVIQFSSVPALTSEQIVLMLTTGQIPRQDFGFSQEDRASKLAFFLGKSLWSKLNPSKPAEERLTIRSGEDVTEQGKQTYEVEYKLSDRWSLVGEYNRFGDLNANVKWRVFSK